MQETTVQVRGTSVLSRACSSGPQPFLGRMLVFCTSFVFLQPAVPELPGPADAGEPPATASEGEDGGDMELAWQMLETSRVIFSNMSGASSSTGAVHVSR